ncbi:MAG: ATP-binding protein [Gemmatimonadetes bacterium]|nr:ATP-binding protein [Gemmatimonadota bacterium]
MPSDYVIELPNDIRSIGRAVEYLAQRCRQAGFRGERLRLNFRVGVTEALANAMLYGNGRDPRKRVRVEARCTPWAVVVRVTDEGRGFDPELVPDPTVPPRVMEPGGRGIFLIRQLMDQVEFNEAGNSITMILRGRPERRRRRQPDA